MSNDITIKKTKNQHYVPRMYLKRFGYGTDKKPKISVLFKKDGKVLHNQSPWNFASTNYFYDVPKDMLKDNKYLQDEQFVEHALSREEGAYNQMLNDLEANSQSIYTEQTRAIFISFVHSLAYRTKSFRDMIDKMNEKTEQVLREMCDNVGLSEEDKANSIKTNCISGQQQQIENLVSLVPTLGTMNKLLINYNWYIAYNYTDLDFIISDDPAKPIWLGLNDICIPISKKLAIILRVKAKDAPLFSKDISDGNIINMSLQGVTAYNLIQIGMSQKYLFGSEKAIQCMSELNDLINNIKNK